MMMVHLFTFLRVAVKAVTKHREGFFDDIDNISCFYYYYCLKSRYLLKEDVQLLFFVKKKTHLSRLSSVSPFFSFFAFFSSLFTKKIIHTLTPSSLSFLTLSLRINTLLLNNNEQLGEKSERNKR